MSAYPPYLPLLERVGLRCKKIYRQAMVRRIEANALERGDGHAIAADGPGDWTPRAEEARGRGPEVINKNALWVEEDLARPEIKSVVSGIEALKAELKSKNLFYTNDAASFLPHLYLRSERNKAWENAWTIFHSGVKSGHRVMDIGGASTPFSLYLASLGCSVAVVDNDWNNCGTLFNAEYVAKKMGWKLRAYDRDVARPLPFPSNSFDRVFSICTVEHLASPTRRAMIGEVGRILAPEGIAAITFCYDPNHQVLLVDKGLRFGYRQKLEEDLIKPSGLKLLGNSDLVDFEDEKGFLGAIFLKKA